MGESANFLGGGGRIVVILFIWVSAFHILGSDGLKDVRLEASGYVRKGEDVRLRCNYDTETESLYTLKWYRGSEEFYRYLPKEVPPKQVFPVSGIDVDLNISDDHNVILKNASSAMNGKYKCVVSAEGSFQTMFDAKDILVVVVGYDSPKLLLEKLDYHPGEIGKANCTLEKTFPTANITWYINDKQVDRKQVVTRILEDPLDYPLTSTLSTLVFNVSSSYSPMNIKCKGELYDLYSETSNTRIQPKPPSFSSFGGMPDPMQRSNVTYRGSAVGRQSGESNLSHLLSAQLLLHTFLMLRFGDRLDCPHLS